MRRGREAGVASDVSVPSVSLARAILLAMLKLPFLLAARS